MPMLHLANLPASVGSCRYALQVYLYEAYKFSRYKGTTTVFLRPKYKYSNMSKQIALIVGTLINIKRTKVFTSAAMNKLMLKTLEAKVPHSQTPL